MGQSVLTEHELRHADGGFRVVVLGGVSDTHGNRPCAAVFGQPQDGCLVRIHSRCVYGEIFESVDCDCRDQLRNSMAMMRTAGAGVLIYLDQEGRGAGLLTKALGYQLSQQHGLDTFTSYRTLGVPEDSRSYEDAVAILHSLNLKRIRLLTNNPMKVAALSTADFQVEQQLFLVPGQSPEARRYLAAKAEFGHTISLAELEADAAASIAALEAEAAAELDSVPAVELAPVAGRDRWRWLRKLLRREQPPATVLPLPVPQNEMQPTDRVSQNERQPTDLVS